MTTLDCADSSQSTPKRDETLTTLQALSLLNNKFTLEMSNRFGWTPGLRHHHSKVVVHDRVAGRRGNGMAK